MNKLIIMCGLIGSGKTTWIKNYLKDHEALVISKDDIRRMLHGGKYVYEEKLEDAIHVIVDSVVYQFADEGKTVVLDECHLTADDRWLFSNYCGKNTTIVYFPPKDKKWHVDRRMKDSYGYSREVWEGVYDKQIAQLEPPTEDECDELIIIGETDV